MDSQYIYFFLLIAVLSYLTQQVLSWVGSSLHKIGDVNREYAYFVFKHDRTVPMTSNILLNIAFPNLVMIFLYQLLLVIKWERTLAFVWLYVVAFFVWRALIICVILRRKEFYKVKYEAVIALITILLAVFLNNKYLLKTDTIFISVSELREEIAFAMIVVGYDFFKKLIDNKVVQQSVLSDDDMNKYIERRLRIFQKRFFPELNLSYDYNRKFTLLFSLMIFEDFNRGPEKRFIENLLVSRKHPRTVGIMQVESSKRLSDVESIKIALKRIEDFIKEYEIDEFNLIQVVSFANEYNPDDEYAENVVYIFETLNEMYPLVYPNAEG